VKLATLKNNTRDGRLIIVSRDLKKYSTPDHTLTLQAALDNWDEIYPTLNSEYEALNCSSAGDSLNLSELSAPMPRAYEWVDGSAYINHIVLVRKARGAEPPPSLRNDPLVYQGGSGDMLAWNAPIDFANSKWGLDFESEIAVVLGDTPKSTDTGQAQKHIRLVTIINDISLRGLIPNELAKGFGFFCSKPATAFAPVMVTPDELGSNWKDGKLHRPLVTTLNGKTFGNPDAGNEMHFSFHELIAHITKTRKFISGTILGSGTVSNEDRSKGSSCLMERRMIEIIDNGEATTNFLQPGDQVTIDMVDDNGSSIFGKIDQTVQQI
jgi:fumarylacetoacetate (FAA) hydrolase